MDDPPRRELFDEELYLRTFPDIAQAVRDGQFSSGYHHWALHGRFEVAAGQREAGIISARCARPRCRGLCGQRRPVWRSGRRRDLAGGRGARLGRGAGRRV